MAERGRSEQFKLPFREPVLTTSLRTGESEVRIRYRKRVPQPEEDFERAKKANDWWNNVGRDAFHRSLRHWGFLKSAQEREIGESANDGSAAMDEADSTQRFLDALKDARRLQIDPFAIARRIKSFAEILQQRRAPESDLLGSYYPQVMDLFKQAYPRVAESKMEALLEFLRFQKTLPVFTP